MPLPPKPKYKIGDSVIIQAGDRFEMREIADALFFKNSTEWEYRLINYQAVYAKESHIINPLI